MYNFFNNNLCIWTIYLIKSTKIKLYNKKVKEIFYFKLFSCNQWLAV